MYFINRSNKRGGCVVIYVRNTISSKEIASSSFSIDNELEYVSIGIIKPSSKNIAVSYMYRAPTSDVAEFIRHIDEKFSNIRSRKILYILNDCNINFRSNVNNILCDFFDIFSAVYMISLLTKPFRIAKTSSTTDQ